mmetsp:Transcript_25176/g.29000  ORF Transcript_25176/g.29000 Transcript_25176/m.29000 type:complete len:236 (-) Transcript_25176:364-1071(-)
MQESEWFKKDVNVVDPSHDPNAVKLPKALKEFTPEETQAWVERVDQAFQSVKDELLAMVDSDKPDEEKLVALGAIDLEEAKLPMLEENAPEKLTKTTKHTLQHSAIIDMMENYGLVLDKDVRYLEYGAGRGILSQYLHDKIAESWKGKADDEAKASNIGFYCVERDKIRFLADRHYKAEGNQKRIRVDIAHFDISHIYKENSVETTQIGSLQQEEGKEDRTLTKPVKVIGIAKHL